MVSLSIPKLDIRAEGKIGAGRENSDEPWP